MGPEEWARIFGAGEMAVAGLYEEESPAKVMATALEAMGGECRAIVSEQYRAKLAAEERTRRHGLADVED